jgi:hypothetical protein
MKKRKKSRFRNETFSSITDAIKFNASNKSNGNEGEYLEQIIILDETINQRSSKNVEQKCEKLAFDHDSTVSWSLVAAEHDDTNLVHIGKQS